MQKQQSTTFKPLRNLGYIDCASRYLLCLICLSPPFLGLSGGFLVFPLISLLPFVSAMTRWDPIYALLRMNSLETDDAIDNLIKNARNNLALDWARFIRAIRSPSDGKPSTYLAIQST